MSLMQKMIGKQSNIFPQPSKVVGTTPVYRRMFSDYDGDGVKNVFDCKPNDPTKQGLAHRVAKRGARKLLSGSFKHRAEKFIERKEAESDAAKKIRIEERQKQRLETTRLKEQERGRSRREYIKGGGFFGAVGRGLKSATKAIPKLAPAQTKEYKTVYRKKGKKRVAVRVPVEKSKRMNPMDFDLRL